MTPPAVAPKQKNADVLHAPTHDVRQPGNAAVPPAPLPIPTDPFALQELLDSLGREQRERWRRGDHVPLELLLERYPGLHDLPCIFNLIYAEYLLRERLDASGSLAKFQVRFPAFAKELERQVRIHRVFAWLHKSRRLTAGKVPITFPPQ